MFKERLDVVFDVNNRIIPKSRVADGGIYFDYPRLYDIGKYPKGYFKTLYIHSPFGAHATLISVNEYCRKTRK